jgi:hypothetical protein
LSSTLAGQPLFYWKHTTRAIPKLFCLKKTAADSFSEQEQNFKSPPHFPLSIKYCKKGD